ncbi:MAG: hypothetical protein KAH99_04185 [Verrucomicrobia bacterium]|nr:hypothetical protein [Verrucomicrobiota bacterium]
MKNRFVKQALLPALIACAAASGAEEKKEPIIKDLGADFRYRVISENARKLNNSETGNERVWQRFRLRAWTSIRLVPKTELNLRMVAEPRYYHYSDPAPPDYDTWVRDEFLFDNANVTVRNPYDIPLTAIFGRQQIRLADSWLVGEGTPLDGTRTAYFDAIRTLWNIENWRTTIDLMYIDNRKDSRAYLSPINDFSFDMMKQDERGGVLYVSHEAQEQIFMDSYFIYKLDHNPTYNTDGTKKGVEGETYTFGFRGHGSATDSLTFNAELAPQFGHKNGTSLAAFAINTWAQQQLSVAKNASIRLGYEFLSGDSNIDRHYDKLWGREGLWSDLYTGGVDGFDGRELDSSNLHRPHAILVVHPFTPLKIFAEYSLLFAAREVDLPDQEKVDGGSMLRGHHVKAAIEHKFNKHLKHYVTAQAMVPGGYYSDERSDTATWFRYGVELAW